MTSHTATTSTRLIEVPSELVGEVEQLIASRNAAVGKTLLLNYQSPAISRRPFTDWSLTIVLGLLAAVHTATYLIFFPTILTAHLQLKIHLPSATIWYLITTQLDSSKYGFVWFWVLALLYPVVWARIRRWPPRDHGRPRASRYLILSVILLAGSAVIAYFLMIAPMLKVRETINAL